MSPESTVIPSNEMGPFEELRRNRSEPQSFERSESLVDYRAGGHQIRNDLSGVNDSRKYDDVNNQRKHSSASKLREQVGLASRHGSPLVETSRTTSGHIDEVTDKFNRFSVRNSDSSRVSPVDKDEEIEHSE